MLIQGFLPKFFNFLYVDSDDSSLAGIDDLEWVETGEGNDAAQKIVPQSQGGIVDDEVMERMYTMKRKLM